MRFRRSQDAINIMKILIIIAMLLLVIMGLAWTELVKSAKFILMLTIAWSLVMVLGGECDWIYINETGITETKLLDKLKKNGKQRKFEWDKITAISIQSAGRGGWIVYVVSGKEWFYFTYRKERYNYIKQYYPNIILENVSINDE